MKREFLEGLELNGTKLTKDLIDQIMAENGKDINREKGIASSLQTQLDTANNTIKELQDAAKKFEGTDPEKLKNDLADLQKKYDADIAAAKLDSALDMALMQAKARDLKAARALLKLDDIKLDGEKLLGFDGQMEALKKEKAWLFEADEPPGDPTPADPPPTPGPTVKTGGNHGDTGKAEPLSLAGALSGFYNPAK